MRKSVFCVLTALIVIMLGGCALNPLHIVKKITDNQKKELKEEMEINDEVIEEVIEEEGTASEDYLYPINVNRIDLSSNLVQEDIESDTIQWFNATYAPLTAANNGDYTLIGGDEKNPYFTQLYAAVISRDWGVDNRKDAYDMIEWLIYEGHHQSYLERIRQMEEDGWFELDSLEAKEEIEKAANDTEEKNKYLTAYHTYQIYGEKGIKAWDLCRAIQLCGDYYLCDYYTLEEAMNQSLLIAKLIQEEYGSWEEMAESYLLGYEYWRGEDGSDKYSATYRRRTIYEELQEEPQGPYTVDWNTELKDTWSGVIPKADEIDEPEEVESVEEESGDFIDVTNYAAEDLEYSIIEEKYILDEEIEGITYSFDIIYPRIVYDDGRDVEEINKMFEECAMSSVDYYLMDSNGDMESILEGFDRSAPFFGSTVLYQITYMSNDMISVAFYDRYCPLMAINEYSSLFTRNINLETGERFSMVDLYDFDKKFADRYREDLNEGNSLGNATQLTNEMIYQTLQGEVIDGRFYTTMSLAEDNVVLNFSYAYSSDELITRGCKSVVYPVDELIQYENDSVFWELYY